MDSTPPYLLRSSALASLIIITRRTRPSSVVLSSRQFSTPLQTQIGSASDARAVGVFSRQYLPPAPRLRVSLLFFSPLSFPIVGRELEVRERSDDREFSREIVTKLLTASRPTRARRCRGFSQVSRYRCRYRRRHPLTCVVGVRMPTSEEQNQLWNARFYASRRR